MSLLILIQTLDKMMVMVLVVVLVNGVTRGFGWIRAEGSAPKISGATSMMVGGAGGSSELEVADSEFGLLEIQVLERHTGGKGDAVQRQY